MRTLALLGGAGRGKSFAATWPLANPRGDGMWLPANEIRIPQWDELRARAVGAVLLVVDDLGREPNDWAAREACDLVESRHNRGARTIVTSNLPLRIEDVPEASRAAWKGRTLTDRYGDRFISRLSHPEHALVVKCTGPDLRRALT
jgi:DNA replication protein DnaC